MSNRTVIAGTPVGGSTRTGWLIVAALCGAGLALAAERVARTVPEAPRVRASIPAAWGKVVGVAEMPFSAGPVVAFTFEANDGTLRHVRFFDDRPDHSLMVVRTQP